MLKRILYCCAALPLALCLLAWGCYRYQVRQALESLPAFPGQGSGGEFRPTMELLKEPLKKDGVTLHSLLYDPTSRAALATFRVSSHLPSFYLEAENGTEYDGWYIPDQVRHGVYKVFFEDLESASLSSLRCEYARGAAVFGLP